MLTWLLVIVAVVMAVAVTCFLAFWLSELRRPRVVCLMYHRLLPKEAYDAATGTERVYALPVEHFDEQLSHLRQTGYRFLTADEVRRFAVGELALNGPAVLITFDDGCRSVHVRAVPILERHGACATVFATTDPASKVFTLGGGERRMTDDELRAIQAGPFDVESHGVTHEPLRGMTDGRIRHELAGSKQQLENVLSRPVTCLAIPGNWYDRRVMRIAREEGYQAVWCSKVGAVRRNTDLFGLPRVNIDGELTLEQFVRAITPFGLAQRKMVSMIKSAPGRLLGPHLWLPARQAILRCVPGGFISFARWRIVLAGGMVLLIVLIGVVALLSD